LPQVPIEGTKRVAKVQAQSKSTATATAKPKANAKANANAKNRVNAAGESDQSRHRKEKGISGVSHVRLWTGNGKQHITYVLLGRRYLLAPKAKLARSVLSKHQRTGLPLTTQDAQLATNVFGPSHTCTGRSVEDMLLLHGQIKPGSVHYEDHIVLCPEDSTTCAYHKVAELIGQQPTASVSSSASSKPLPGSDVYMWR
jgi:hypothetical protein